MNDLRRAKNQHSELERPVRQAIADIMDTAPPPADQPTDQALLGDFGSRRSTTSRNVLGAAAASVLLLGALGLFVVVDRQGPDTGTSELLPTAETDVDSTQMADNLPPLYLPNRLPEGYEIVGLAAHADDTSDPLDGESTQVLATRIDGEAGGFLLAEIVPNTADDTLETLTDPANAETVGDFSDFDRRSIGGIDRLVRTESPDALGPFSTVVWFDSNNRVTVTGRAAPEQVVEFAADLRAVDQTAFEVAGDEITSSAQALEVLDRATFADGSEVSVRSINATSGVAAICIDAPLARCSFSLGFTSPEEVAQSRVFAAIDDGSGARIIGWTDTAETARLGEPVVSAATQLDTEAEGSSNDLAVEEATTSLGRFLTLPIPDGEAPPVLSFDLDDGSTTNIDLETPTRLIR